MVAQGWQAEVERFGHTGVWDGFRYLPLLIACCWPACVVVAVARDLDEAEGEGTLVPLCAPVLDERREDAGVVWWAHTACIGFALIPDHALNREARVGRVEERGRGPASLGGRSGRVGAVAASCRRLSRRCLRRCTVLEVRFGCISRRSVGCVAGTISSSPWSSGAPVKPASGNSMFDWPEASHTSPTKMSVRSTAFGCCTPCTER